MKSISVMLGFVCGAVFSLMVFSQFAFTDKIQNQPQWPVPAIPSQLSFANETVPIARWDVKEKFDRELLRNYYDPGVIVYLLKLAKKNFPVISERLKINGVPDDFKYLCIAESNMQSWAVSKSGAVGYWQFMNGTAPGYGLQVSKEVDQRQDLERSTDAACKYLKQAFAKFGNWTAAAASYNCGMGGYSSAAGFQQTNNYYDLHLPEETNKYIYRILAFKYLLENATSLGYHLQEEEKYNPVSFRTITVSSSIPNLASFALENGTTYKMLLNLNPWLKGKSLTVTGGKSYILKLPAADETTADNK